MMYMTQIFNFGVWCVMRAWKRKKLGHERTRRVVQAELLAEALDLFLSQGFEATTVDQTARAAGMSRRSFFRYFASKGDVLALALAATGADVA